MSKQDGLPHFTYLSWSKMALAAYAAEISSAQQLSSHQLDTMKRVIEI